MSFCSSHRRELLKMSPARGGSAAKAPQSPRKNQAMTAYVRSISPMYTPDLEQSGQHNSIWAPPETQVSLWATLQHTDETRWHCSTNRPEVWAWQLAATISACRYLPGLSHRNMHATRAEIHGADLTAMPLLPWMWLIVRLLDAVNCSDRNKRIRHTHTHTPNLAMSQSLFEWDSMKRQEMVKAVLWRSQCASVYTWFIGAGTENNIPASMHKKQIPQGWNTEALMCFCQNRCKTTISLCCNTIKSITV